MDTANWEINLEAINLAEASLHSAHVEAAHVEAVHVEVVHVEEAHLEGASMEETNMGILDNLEGINVDAINFEINIQATNLAYRTQSVEYKEP